MEMLMLGMIAVCGLVALTNWRHAIFLVIIVDALRDPIRKLAPAQPVWISQAIILDWAVIIGMCLSTNTRVLLGVRRVFPGLQQGSIFFIVGLLPGAALSLLLYRNGWILAGIGGLSYAGPLAGLFVGICFAERSRDVFKLMQLYVVLNSLVLSGSFAEYLGLDWPGLGGLLGHEWIRHMPGVLVHMVSGFFRSPEIAGFHAAHVVIFSILLAVSRGKGKNINPQWLVLGLWAGAALFLAGRRKMFSISVVFLIVWVLADYLRKQQGSKNLLLFVGLVLVLVGGGGYFLVEKESNLAHHQIYLATTLYDVAPNLYDHAFSDSITTIEQSGVLGSGLGYATQGAQYSGIDRTQAWQEDGVSRLFKEIGVVGVIFMVMAGVQFGKELRRAFRFQMMDSTRVLLQNGGVAIFMANLACFVASHQHISGDVANGVLPLLFLGGVFGHVLADQKCAAAQQAAIDHNFRGPFPAREVRNHKTNSGKSLE
jgi:hypothetical protein